MEGYEYVYDPSQTLQLYQMIHRPFHPTTTNLAFLPILYPKCYPSP